VPHSRDCAPGCIASTVVVLAAPRSPAVDPEHLTTGGRTPRRRRRRRPGDRLRGQRSPDHRRRWPGRRPHCRIRPPAVRC